MKIAVNSDQGLRRNLNEDSVGYFYNQAQIPLLIVCDGIGGHNAGDVASSMAVSHLGADWEKSSLTQFSDIHLWLVDHIRQENDRIYEKARTFRDLDGMGTTLVASVIIGDQLLVANVGDSRAYLYRAYHLKQLTEDHSLVNELIKSGEITPDEAQNHPKRNYVTRSVGVSFDVNIDFLRVTLKDQDIVLLCSDGLSNMLSIEEIQTILTNVSGLEQQAQEAINAANQAGGRDNITIALAKIALPISQEDNNND
ncbi:Stp1/IreP family PP2C-type Ser/Thr phosphatase [Granulicatella seriolae]|uniref:Stp1/IreP family PP2C-type Ser/Thr phosphatase n=1 Tax=Granulicatella seriolae TaxID=2967226 RepID=A0ABT1WMH0_9LACT|nr:Stp1/IreP family PP2C-type Ser/Thr phosphatase [Granulicatella seriolae]